MASSGFEFVLNGRAVRVEGTSANTSLLAWLRSTGRTGSKEGCAEGDCGACTVALVDTDARGERTYRAINSCITLLPMVAGREVVTVEGVAPRADGRALHPVQQAMVERYGSQCGYCTPGFVVSMFEALLPARRVATSAARRSAISSAATSAAAPATGRSATRCATRSRERAPQAATTSSSSA